MSTLEDEATFCLEMSGYGYPLTQRNVTEVLDPRIKSSLSPTIIIVDYSVYRINNIIIIIIIIIEISVFVFVTHY